MRKIAFLIWALFAMGVSNLQASTSSLSDIKSLLTTHSDTLKPEVIDTVITSIQCAQQQENTFNHILTIIDYSLPSNQKRMWVFDTKNKQLLFHTYVSHGITSGTLATTHFSNTNNSKASSIGFYTTEEVYVGRHGISIRLLGHDTDFNHNAYERDIVMHGAWYVNKEFAEKYGRLGRSWGCPSVPKDLAEPIINALSEPSIFVIYYPSQKWFAKSRYLNCKNINTNLRAQALKQLPSGLLKNHRSSIVYLDKNNNRKYDKNEPVLVMPVEDYKQMVQTRVPLSRMLRKQFKNTEYIAITQSELSDLSSSPAKRTQLTAIDLVIPVVTILKDTTNTEFKSVKPNKFDISTLQLRSSNQFIRWLGL